MNRFMPRYTQKDLINLFLGKIKKKRGRTGSRRDMPVQRGEPVRAALVHIVILSGPEKKNIFTTVKIGC